MTAPVPSDAQAAAASDATPQQALARLRGSGAWRADPAGFHFLEALSRRIPQQQEPVRSLLEARLHAALAAYAARVEAKEPQADGAVVRVLPQASPRAASSPLAELNQHIRRVAGSAGAEAQASLHELASARRFRRTWERQRTLEQVEQAVSNRPANAGPLNSHALVVQSLDWMRALSPDYLRQFVGYAETLLWLEQATARPAREQGRAARPASARGRQKKAGPRKAPKDGQDPS
jgi:hypothetical protein